MAFNHEEKNVTFCVDCFGCYMGDMLERYRHGSSEISRSCKGMGTCTKDVYSSH